MLSATVSIRVVFTPPSGVAGSVRSLGRKGGNLHCGDPFDRDGYIVVTAVENGAGGIPLARLRPPEQ
ncbi:hypothetical protein KRM28CT15_41960 [Krasilnikovia sp. M28-CT-15]